MNPATLTDAERVNVRTALRFLRAKFGTWKPVAKALCVDVKTVNRRDPSALTAFRIARVVGVSVDDVLQGRYPVVGTCAYCGHRKDET